MIIAGIGLAGATVLLARRRRRRGDEPDVDDAGANAPSPAPVPARAAPRRASASRAPARPLPVPAAAAPAPAFAPATGAAAWVDPLEVGVPRWRRASLKEARAKSDRVAAPAHRHVTFGLAAQSGVERSVVRYDLVPLLDQPDEVTGLPVGDLQAGDEVEAVGKRGVWTEVRNPRGAVGWVHRTTLQALESVTLDDLPLEQPANAMASVAPEEDVIEPEALDRMLAKIVADRAAAAAELAARGGDSPPGAGPPAPGLAGRPLPPPSLRPATDASA